MRRGWLLVLAAIVAVRVTGLVTVGLVTSESMEPTLPEGSVFLSVPGDAEPGDLVVYRAPDGARVVHRVVEVLPGGLVTQGDANGESDQANGLPLVDPDEVRIVPETFGPPLALRASWLRPAAVGLVQALLLTLGLRALLKRRRRAGTAVSADRRRGLRAPPPTSRAERVLSKMRPHHLFALAGAILLASTPLLAERIDADGAFAVRSAFLPTHVRVETSDNVTHHELPLMGELVLEADGPVEIVRAPALPGARVLSDRGAVWAMLPAAALAFGAALVLRSRGW